MKNNFRLLIFILFSFIYSNLIYGESLNDKQINECYNYIKKIVEKDENSFLYVDIKTQTMYLIENKKVIKSYEISSGLKGSERGAVAGSGKTPLGLLKIESKLGDSAKIGDIFKFKRNTGKTAKIYQKGDEYPKNIRDEVLTRVLTLQGMEKGINKGKNKNNIMVDAFYRAIYIHGTNNEAGIGKPISHGCIRMLNDDVVDLYNRIKTGTLVLIL